MARNARAHLLQRFAVGTMVYGTFQRSRGAKGTNLFGPDSDLEEMEETSVFERDSAPLHYMRSFGT